MPELRWKYGYVLFWGLVVGFILLVGGPFRWSGLWYMSGFAS